MKLNFHPLIKAGSVALAIILIGGATEAVRSQGPAPASTPQPESTDVEVLKDRVRQLEETVLALKKQMGMIEDMQKPTAAPVLSCMRIIVPLPQKRLPSLRM